MAKKGEQKEFSEVYLMIAESNEHHDQLRERLIKLRTLRGDLAVGINDLETAINTTLSGNSGLMAPATGAVNRR